MGDSQCTVLDPEDAAHSAAQAAALAAAAGEAAIDLDGEDLGAEIEVEEEEEDAVQVLGPLAGTAAPAPWACVACTRRNAPSATSCASCECFRGLQYSRGGNFFASSDVLEPSQITPWLYIGALSSASGPWLRFFTHIVGVCQLPGPHPAADLGALALAHLRVSDACGGTIGPSQYAAYGAMLAPAFAVLNRCRQAGGRCLVHCKHGMSRSVCVAAAYLLQHPEALPTPLPPTNRGQHVLAFIRSRRPAAKPAWRLAAAVAAFGASSGGSGGGGASSSGGGGCVVA
jgi:hypothetical protein